MAQIVEVQVLDLEDEGGVDEVLADGATVIREDAILRPRLAHDDLECIVPGEIEQWYIAVVADLFLRMFPVPHADRPILLVEIAPPDARNFRDAHGRGNSEVNQIARGQRGVHRFQVPYDGFDLGIADAAVALLRCRDHAHSLQCRPCAAQSVQRYGDTPEIGGRFHYLDQVADASTNADSA